MAPSLRNLLTALVVDRLEVRVRAAVQRAVDGRDPVTPEDVARLTAALDQAEAPLKALQAELATLRAAVDATPRRPRGPGLTERAASIAAAFGAQEDEADALTGALGELSDGGLRARARADAAARRLDEVDATLGATTALLHAVKAGPAPATPIADATAGSASATPIADAPGGAAPPSDAPAETPKVCQVPGCENPHRARGFCGKHYQQVRRGALPGFTL